MEEEEKNTEEEQQAEEEQETEQEQKKSLPINLIIIGILALCLIGGGFFVWKGGLLSGSKKVDASLEMEDTKQDIGAIYSLDTFIVNLVGGRGKNYLKAKLDLELDNEKLTLEIDKRLPQFRDAILTMLSGKTHEDIKTLEGKSQLRAEIISILNQYLKTGKIINVYFTDFIVQ